MECDTPHRNVRRRSSGDKPAKIGQAGQALRQRRVLAHESSWKLLVAVLSFGGI